MTIYLLTNSSIAIIPVFRRGWNYFLCSLLINDQFGFYTSSTLHEIAPILVIITIAKLKADVSLLLLLKFISGRNHIIE